MKRKGSIQLQFSLSADNLGKGKELRDGLSVVLQIGDTLWVANDESLSLERLTLAKHSSNGPYTQAADHQQFPLTDYLDIPLPPAAHSADFEEADVEGLAYDDGYLWLVGSHSLKRQNPDPDDGSKKARKQLRQVSRDGNRYLLARIPLIQKEGSFALVKKHTQEGTTRTAACLPGNDRSNELMKALRKDKHLAPFLNIPGKDNGFDIEGLAVVGKRVLLGLRGPVLRGWAVILEIELREDLGESSTLQLAKFGPKDRLYRKHFLHLGGLGIRDLCAAGDDLLILAGPTLDLDGPVVLYRWAGGTQPAETMVVPNSELERVLNIPYGQGVDHAEGISLFASEGGEATSLLVVYDSASESRQLGASTITADLFDLPQTRTR